MPKKFQGENSKAVLAKTRKADAEKEKLEKKKQQEEDEYWRDDDKQIQKKQQRKDEKDSKKTEQLQRKQELKQMAEYEVQQLAAGKAAVSKLTRAEIDRQNATRAADRLKQQQTQLQEKQRIVVQDDSELLVENVNRLEVDGAQARNVDEAISVLRSGSSQPTDVDAHPEKRLKAAFADFEQRSMPTLKAEHPSLRLSQLKQLLRKEWQRSPENPLNQRIAAIGDQAAGEQI